MMATKDEILLLDDVFEWANQNKKLNKEWTKLENEIMKVLELVQEGKLSNSEAAEIISTLKEEAAPLAVENDSYMSKSLKVIIDSDGDKVNVNLPLKLVKSLHGAIENIPAVQEHLGGADFNLILDAISNNVEGPIVDVDSAKGEIVKIVIE